MYDHFAALLLALAALILLAWGTAKALRENSATSTPADEETWIEALDREYRDFHSDAARRYHESDAVGR